MPQNCFSACAGLDFGGCIKRRRGAVLVHAAILELEDAGVDTLRLGHLQARILLSVESLDVRHERAVLVLPSTAWPALALSERVFRRPEIWSNRRVET